MSDEKGTTPGAGVGRKVIPLSDGRVAEMRPAIGRDIQRATVVTGNSTNPAEISMGLAAQVTTISGKPLLYEELLEMPASDVMSLMGEVLGGNAGSPARAPSSSSAAS